MSAGNTLLSMGASSAFDRAFYDNHNVNQAIFSSDPEVPAPTLSTNSEKPAAAKEPITVEDSSEGIVESFSKINKLVHKRKIELETSKILLQEQINTKTADRDALIEENDTERQKQSRLQITLVTYATSLEVQLEEYKQQFGVIIDLAARVDNKETPVIEKIEVFNQQVAEIGEFLIAITEKDEGNNTSLQNTLIDIANTKAEIAQMESELKVSKEKVEKNKEKILEANKVLLTLQKDLDKLQKQIDVHNQKIRKAGAHALSVLEQPTTSRWRKGK